MVSVQFTPNLHPSKNDYPSNNGILVSLISIECVLWPKPELQRWEAECKILIDNMGRSANGREIGGSTPLPTISQCLTDQKIQRKVEQPDVWRLKRFEVKYGGR